MGLNEQIMGHILTSIHPSGFRYLPCRRLEVHPALWPDGHIELNRFGNAEHLQKPFGCQERLLGCF